MNHIFFGIAIFGLLLIAGVRIIRQRIKEQTTNYLPAYTTTDINHYAMRKWLRQAIRYLKHIRNSSYVTDEQAYAIDEEIQTVKQELRSHPLNDDLQRAIHRLETGILADIHADHDKEPSVFQADTGLVKITVRKRRNPQPDKKNALQSLQMIIQRFKYGRRQ